MEKSQDIEEGFKSIPTQTFQGKQYFLYPNERYFSKGSNRLHRVVWEHYNGKVPKGYHVHHVDGNTHNNEISNLNLLQGSLHLRFTSKKRVKENPEFFKEFQSKGIEAAKEWHKSDEGRLWHKKHGKECWVNRDIKTHICQQCGKEYTTRHAGLSKFCHNNCKAKALRARYKLEGRSLRPNR
jgi:hypothetical protein